MYSPNLLAAPQALTASTRHVQLDDQYTTTLSFPNHRTRILILPLPNVSLPSLFPYLNKSLICTSQNNFIYSVAQAKHHGLLTPLLLVCVTSTKQIMLMRPSSYITVSTATTLSPSGRRPQHQHPSISSFPCPDACHLFSTQRPQQFFKNNKTPKNNPKQSESCYITL